MQKLRSVFEATTHDGPGQATRSAHIARGSKWGEHLKVERLQAIRFTVQATCRRLPALAGRYYLGDPDRVQMNPERWRQVEDLFHAALEKDPGQRDVFLASATNNDEDLRREVESLIAKQEHSILESSPWQSDASSSDAMLPQIGLGSQIGPYKIEAVLGVGGMGQVFKACDVRSQRTVAIKVLAHTAFARWELKRRFLQEGRAASALNHPNIVTLYDAGTEEGLDFLAMEYVPGQISRSNHAGEIRTACATRWISRRRSRAGWLPHTPSEWFTATSSHQTLS